MELKAITAVYSYYFPEVRRKIDELIANYPHDVFLRSIKPGLDDLHVPIIDLYLSSYCREVPRLKDFCFRYPTAGAEEGIREIMTFLQSRGVEKIYVLRGEYEGYRAVAETRRIETIEVDLLEDPETLEPGYWFLSNPSARNGNIIYNYFIKRICEAGHQLFYDLSYVGLTPFYEFDLSHPNIFAVAVSFSKPFGLFYYRAGFTFSRQEIPSLYGNKWFKNIFSLLIVEKLISDATARKIVNRYGPIQQEIITEINQQSGLCMRASDVLLLGYLTQQDAESLTSGQLEAIERFRRGSYYRFCLTPYFQELEKRAVS